MSDRKCKNCETKLIGKFCSECGQKDVHLFKLKDLTNELARGFTELDFRILVTLKKLFISPGFLTREYWSGRKVSYTQPFKLFLFSSIIYYFLVSSYYPVNTSEILYKNLVNETGKQEPITIAFYFIEIELRNSLLISSFANSQIFGDKYEKEINIIFSLPIYALLLLLFHLNKKSLYLPHHFITALHLSSFSYFLKSILLFFTTVIPIMKEDSLEYIHTPLFSLYLLLNFRNVYDNSIILSITKTVLMFIFVIIYDTLIVAIFLAFGMFLYQWILV